METYEGKDVDQYMHDQIVHQLRSQGWSREDAIERADVLVSMRKKSTEKAKVE